MTDDKNSPLPTALVQIRDVLGFSAPLQRLVEAISHGVGRWVYPVELRRNTDAEIKAFRAWAKAAREEGIQASQFELTLHERTAIRVSSQETRRQEHREAISAQAIDEVRARPQEFSGSEVPLDLDWLDRFWRLAEDVGDAEFQSIWARILARHVAAGRRYSARSLVILSTLSRTEAEVLERLAPVAVKAVVNGEEQLPSVVTRIGDHIFADGSKPNDTRAHDAQKRIIDEEVLPFRQELLGPIGVYVENGWAHAPTLSVEGGVADIFIGGRRFHVRDIPDNIRPKPTAMRFGAGMQFSSAGAEILSLIRTEPNPRFVAASAEIMKLCGMRLVPA